MEPQIKMVDHNSNFGQVKGCLQQFQVKEDFISMENQYVISLGKLTIPQEINPKKVIVSVVMENEQQLFIQTQRKVSTNKINLYRQNLFLPRQPKDLAFNIYKVQGQNKKIMLKQLQIPSQDLITINQKPTMFKTEDSCFELVWESWIFSEVSQDPSSYLQRDYSQLNLPMKYQNSIISCEKLILQQESTANTTYSSLDQFLVETLSVGSKVSLFPQVVEAIQSCINQKVKEKKVPQAIIKQLQKIKKNDKNKIKNQVCNNLIKQISNFFSWIPQIK